LQFRKLQTGVRGVYNIPMVMIWDYDIRELKKAKKAGFLSWRG